MQHSTINNISDRVHPNCVVCSPFNTNGLLLEFISGKNGSVTATFSRGKDLEGYPGVVHGGILSSILDGGMGHCMFSCGQVAVTVKMTKKFQLFVVTNLQAIISANIV